MNPHRTRIKICGIKQPADALFAAESGADAIGLNFHRASSRFVDPVEAAEISSAIPPFVASVGLFVDATADQVRAVLDAVPLQLLQFHGDEPPEFCVQFGRPYLKALRMKPGADLIQFSARYRSASATLVDAFRPGIPGGTGETFDWGLIPGARSQPLVLSGGLTAGNVAAGMERVRPWAVDVSSGVESTPGVKDLGLIARFIDAVRRADEQRDATYEYRQGNKSAA